MDFVKICKNDERYINKKLIKEVSLEYSVGIKGGYDVIIYIKGEKLYRIVSSHNTLDEARMARDVLVNNLNKGVD